MTYQVPPFKAVVEPGGRLGDLLAAYSQLKPQADELAERLKAVTTAIKAELSAQAPTAERIDVAHEALAQPLRLTYVKRWRLDSNRLKTENPALYVTYAVQDNRWELRAVSS